MDLLKSRRHCRSKIFRLIWNKKLLLAIICATSVVKLIHKVTISGDTRDAPAHIVYYPGRTHSDSSVKNILAWRPFTVGLDDVRACLARCPHTCAVTDTPGDLPRVDAVLFHLQDLWKNSTQADRDTRVNEMNNRNLISLPEYRQPNQVWVLWNQRSPEHVGGNVAELNGLFNWTVWYRSDATVVWSYGQKRQLDREESERMSDLLKSRNVFREKIGDIIGVLDICNDKASSFQVISKLRTYLAIDMFGECYHEKCPSKVLNSDCDELLRKYKFYIAFESSHCQDYVTDKYWSALDREQIPIVNWKNVNASLVIQNSYINIYDFDSIKHAADYIQKVASNEELFNSYFRWKYQYATGGECASCSLCQALHDTTRPAQVYTHLDSWINADTCTHQGVRCTQTIGYPCRHLRTVPFMVLI